LLEEIKRDVELLHDKDTQELKAAIKTFEDGPPKNMAAPCGLRGELQSARLRYAPPAGLQDKERG
jgi:hypothetical protein